MIKAIFTNIKDEHRYLEEWFEYHIRLGINKFIIYEDEGSRSHAEIINKYSKVTSIDFYDYVLKKDAEEFKDITCFKHVIENYNNIDWLIKLDPDEYIVLPGELTIDDILYGMPPYINQLTLYWELHNANGYINAPEQGKYSLMDTYVNSIHTEDLADYFNNNISANNYHIGKSFIRYNKIWEMIRDGDKLDLHGGFPHWIYPDDGHTTLYGDEIGCHINHYITKSFEEFYIRLKDKGEYNKEFYRKLGDFFVLNPDLIPKIPEIESAFDVNIFSFETKLN